MSEADVCFIRCRTNMLECLSENNGSEDCEAEYPGCMGSCLPEDEHSSESMLSKRQIWGTSDTPPIDCSPTDPCLRGCDLELKNCLIAAGPNANNAPHCQDVHTNCAANHCGCDSLTDSNGYPVYSEARMCMQWALYHFSECEGANCEAELTAALDKCLPSQITKRDDWTKHFYFHEGLGGTGKGQTIIMTNNECQNIQFFKSERLKSMVLDREGEVCKLFIESNCGGATWHVCVAQPGLAKNICTFNTVMSKLVSVRCTWPKSGSKRDVVAVNDIEKRQAARHFKFFYEPGRVGYKEEIAMQNGACLNAQLGGYHPNRWRSIELKQGESCTVYGTDRCSGPSRECNEAPGCDITQGQQVVRAVKCSWKSAGRSTAAEIAVVEKRQATRDFVFFFERQFKGISEIVPMRSGICVDVTKSYHPHRWQSIGNMRTNEVCTVYESRDCTGAGRMCATTPGCDISQEAAPLNSVLCAFRSARSATNTDVQIKTKRQIAQTRSIEFWTAHNGDGRLDYVMVQSGKCSNIAQGKRYGSMHTEPDETCAIYALADCGGPPFWCINKLCDRYYEDGAAARSIFCTWPKPTARDISSSEHHEEKRQASRHTIEFYSEKGLKGTKTLIAANDNVCNNVGIRKQYKSLFLIPGEKCTLYFAADCATKPDFITCETDPKKANICDFRATKTGQNADINSMKCTWPEKKRQINAPRDIEENRQPSPKGPDHFISLYTEEGLKGSNMRQIRVRDWDCVSQDLRKYKSLLLRPGQFCRLYSQEHCTGGGLTGGDVIKASVVNFPNTAALSITCIWGPIPIAGQTVQKREEDFEPRPIDFFTEEHARGEKTTLVLFEGACTGFDASNFRSMLLDAGETCTLHALDGCQGESTKFEAIDPLIVNLKGPGIPRSILCRWAGRLASVPDKRQIFTRMIEFYTEEFAQGELFQLPVQASHCKDFDGSKYKSALAGPGETCSLYEFSGCAGSGHKFGGLPNDTMQVTFRGGKVKSIFCVWVD